MPEKLTKEERSLNMSKVHGKNTRPELLVRSFLHKNGFRFRVNRKDIFGHPDVVLPKHKTVIFVHGCFWHRHEGCKRCTTPVNNAEFWQKKFAANVERDELVCRTLEEQGWRVVVVWECETKRDQQLSQVLAREGFVALSAGGEPAASENLSKGARGVPAP